MAYYFKCPSCQRNRSFRIPSEQSDSWPLILFLLGEWVLALLFLGNKGGRVQCGDCGHIFRQPPLPSSPVAKFASWIGFIVFLATFTILIAVVIPLDSTNWPEIGLIAFVEGIMMTHHRLFATVAVVAVALIAVSCVIAGCIANHRFRAEIPEETKPGDKFDAMKSLPEKRQNLPS